MKDMVSTVFTLLLASLDFRETRNVRLTPLTAVLLLPGHTVAAHCGLFELARSAAKLSICIDVIRAPQNKGLLYWIHLERDISRCIIDHKYYYALISCMFV